MTTDKFSALLLDLDGTLYKPLGMKLAMAVEVLALGATSIPALRTFRKLHEVIREELEADPTREFLPSPFSEQLKRAAQVQGVSEAHLRALVERWMIDRPGKWIRLAKRRDLLQRVALFHDAGGKTAVVSDYPARRKLAALGVTDLIDVVVACGEHPHLTRLKPAPDGYLLAAKELGVAPESCLVIGDRQDADGDAARAAGMSFELTR